MAQAQQEVASEAVLIFADCAELTGELAVPPNARAAVVLAHAGTEGRLRPENRAIAETLRKVGIATLLFDLLTGDEARNAHNLLDFHRLARRLQSAAKWLIRGVSGKRFRVGYFGAGASAAAAIIAAATLPEAGAVVSCAGRLEFAGYSLGRVKTPTLFIVDEERDAPFRLHSQAYERLTCPKSIEIVPGAARLSAESDALERAARLACAWFLRHLGQAGTTFAAVSMRGNCAGGAANETRMPPSVPSLLA